MARLYLGFGITAHWGEPENDLALSSDSGLRWRIGGPDSPWNGRRHSHHVDRWYGIDRSGAWAFMFLRMGRHRDMAYEATPTEQQTDGGEGR